MIFPRTHRRRHYLSHREVARNLIHERVAHFAPQYGVTIRRIAIRNQKSRWGSCSRNGNLNFNYKVALLPPELRDYIIVHEICHLKEFNHGRGFWDLVAQVVPEHREMRKKLREIERAVAIKTIKIPPSFVGRLVRSLVGH